MENNHYLVTGLPSSLIICGYPLKNNEILFILTRQRHLSESDLMLAIAEVQVVGCAMPL